MVNVTLRYQISRSDTRQSHTDRSRHAVSVGPVDRSLALYAHTAQHCTKLHSGLCSHCSLSTLECARHGARFKPTGSCVCQSHQAHAVRDASRTVAARHTLTQSLPVPLSGYCTIQHSAQRPSRFCRCFCAFSPRMESTSLRQGSKRMGPGGAAPRIAHPTTHALPPVVTWRIPWNL